MIRKSLQVDRLKLNKLFILSVAAFFISPFASAYKPPQITQVSDTVRGPMNLTEDFGLATVDKTQGIPTGARVDDRDTKIVTDKEEGIDYEICVDEVKHTEGAELEYRYYQENPPVEPDEGWTEERCYNTTLKWEDLATEVHIQVRDDIESPVEELSIFNVDIYYYNLVNPNLEDEIGAETTEYDTVIIPKDEYDQLKSNQRNTEQLQRELEDKEREIRGLENQVERLKDEIDEQSSQGENQIENREKENEIDTETNTSDETETSNQRSEKQNNQNFVREIINSIF